MHHEQQPHDVFLSRVLHCCAGGTVGHICAHVWAGLEAGAIPNDERLSVKSFCEHDKPAARFRHMRNCYPGISLLISRKSSNP